MLNALACFTGSSRLPDCIMDALQTRVYRSYYDAVTEEGRACLRDSTKGHRKKLSHTRLARLLCFSLMAHSHMGSAMSHALTEAWRARAPRNPVQRGELTLPLPEQAKDA